ncbi:MAG: hypothetical protein N3G21_09575 [Candidatus Hydrogenedentes bacterium]|nr:hypothetical protein [Candidatus Hydrogenedentota bacterium]
MRNVYTLMLLILFSFFPIVSYTLDPAFVQRVQAEQKIAYEEICSEKWQEGMKRLIYLFREMPADDVECSDVMISPAQLFIFCTRQYMSGATGTVILERGSSWQIENFGEYPTDTLLSALVSIGDDSMMRYAGFVKLYGLTNSEHRGVRLIASAMCMLLMPREFFKEDPIKFSVRTVGEIKQYAHLNIVKQISLLPLFRYIDEQYITDIKSEKYFYEKVLQSISMYGGGAVMGIGKDIPSLGCLVDKMAELEKQRATLELGVQNLAKAILEEEDITCQYGQLILLCRLGDYLRWDSIIKDTLEALLKRSNKNDPVNVRVKLFLADYSQKAHDVKRIRELSQEMMNWGVLPGVIDTNLYQEQLRALQRLGKYFTRYGWYEDGKLIYSWIAMKYPSSKAGIDAKSWATQIESRPIDASLEMIAGAVEPMRARGELDKVKAYYQDIADHTPNADLRARMMAQLDKCSEKLQYARKPNEGEEWIKAVMAIGDPNTPPSVRNEILQKMINKQQ